MPRSPRRPTLHWIALLLLPAALACSEAGGGSAAEEAPDPIDRPGFDGEAAHELLARQVAFGPRIPGTAGHQAQLAWMREYLEARADTVIVQDFTFTTSGGETLALTNLFARFRPEAQDRLLLVAHWDTRPKADQSKDPAEREMPVLGANDGASGTAVLLHLAELLRQQPPPIGVDLLLVDGEDYGPGGEDMYLGARHFAENPPAGYRPLYGVLVDMVGDQDPRFPVEGYSQDAAPEVVQRVWAVARDLGYAELFPTTPGGYIEDDHVPLNRAGIRTINIIDFDYPHWHTPRDVVENTSPRGLGVVGEVLAELVYRGG